MKNYYDELEVNSNASQEVIERVYKVLAKKYHPDTTQEADKQAAEEKFKAISEAYEVLSDAEKRKKYDLELEQSNPSISYEDYVNMVNERDSLNNALNNLKSEFNQAKNASNTNQQYYNNTAYTQYNQSNSAFTGNNNYYNTNSNRGYSNPNNNTKSKKKTYYYTNTGKPASAFAYYKYKIKNFFQNLGLIILAIIAIALMINAFMGSSLL